MEMKIESDLHKCQPIMLLSLSFYALTLTLNLAEDADDRFEHQKATSEHKTLLLLWRHIFYEYNQATQT